MLVVGNDIRCVVKTPCTLLKAKWEKPNFEKLVY